MARAFRPVAMLAAFLFPGGVAALDAAVDINADQRYSLDELRVVDPAMDEVLFDALDVSGDGLLDETEVKSAEFRGILLKDGEFWR